MTSRALEVFDGAMISGTCADPADFDTVTGAYASTVPKDSMILSRSENLKVAKGVMMALGLEVAACICLYGIWHLWRFLR